MDSNAQGMIRYRILAGNYEQAKNLARKAMLRPTEWSYVYDRDRLLGLDGGVLLVTGTWQDRDDGFDCIQMAQTRGMRILYDD